MKLTSEILAQKGACSYQINWFRRFFPDGVDVTPELCVKHVDKFSWGCAALYLLPSDAYAEYISRRREFESKHFRSNNIANARLFGELIDRS